MKRSKIIVLVLLVCIGGVCVTLWVDEGPLWRVVMLKTVIWEAPLELSGGWLTRGFSTTLRWGSVPVRSVYEERAWYVNNGFLCLETHRSNEVHVFITQWRPDGTIERQCQVQVVDPLKASRIATGPPWRWGMTDQTEPTAPWWNGPPR